ncbi:hypothetical protein GCM10011512_01720 [Tersicoccus solisilvae]|uniref:5,10-methylene-tetrahydrofolate dehydrogenase n=1 Tax=Tersicoccus solisilvae TaxID=1882339 RepID=A0ABQ1NM40_9MICC|nr:hypothetical protein [Tersicoccus solisilvae]GGC78763.1 hypothetical protein GCM10011512_01720 [Tersicoccus solisilvae]
MGEPAVAPGAPQWVRIGVVADEGFPARIAASLTATAHEAAQTALGPEVDIEVQTVIESLPLNDRGEIPLELAGKTLRDRHGWYAVVYLTDLPRLTPAGSGLVGDFDHGNRIVLVSVPALGVAGVRRRARRVVREGLRVVLADDVGDVDPVLINNPVEARLAPIRRTTEPDAENSLFEMGGVRGYTQLLAGMVRSNRPWRLLPSLSGALAGAAAVGAFGVFYTSIYEMSDALSSARLTGISLFSVAVFVSWLIAHNSLWERPSGPAPRRRAVLYNSFTVVTLTLGAMIMYATLFLILLVGALAVIDGGYFTSQLGHPVNVTDYLDLAWLSSSLGTVAGALGSSFDDEQAIRSATYSRRENERHRLIEQLDQAQKEDATDVATPEDGR